MMLPPLRLKLPEEKKVFILIGLFLFVAVYVYATVAPARFPAGKIIIIEEGIGLETLALKLKEEKVIRSPFWFRTFAIVLGGERDMKAGEYYLPHPQNALVVVWRILHADQQLETIKITIPEGYTVKEISSLMDEEFPLFDKSFFDKNARQGYLFPDTYFFKESINASTTIDILEKNFSEKISPYLKEIERSGKTLEEIVIMASIIEGESNGENDRELISGILWKRLKNKIALQVDVAPETYERRGLPEEPINNPGLLSILAALRPKSSPYLYYIHDDAGKIYYARSFEEHKANIQKYLR